MENLVTTTNPGIIDISTLSLIRPESIVARAITRLGELFINNLVDGGRWKVELPYLEAYLYYLISI